jgi:excisionase family DNA binding protein
MSPRSSNDVLNVAEAAALLRVGPKVIRRDAKLRRIPHQRIGAKHQLRFSREALMQWLKEGRS